MNKRERTLTSNLNVKLIEQLPRSHWSDLKEFLWLFIWNLKLLYIYWAVGVFKEPAVPILMSVPDSHQNGMKFNIAC